MNTKLTSTNQYVVELFNSYHERIKTRPSLYNNGSMITVGLPAELLDYANAAAGHSGFGAGARPVGIRIITDQPAKMLAKIFESCESLAKFINSSECNAAEYIARVRDNHAKLSNKPGPNAILIDTRNIKDAFYDIGYDFGMIKNLRAIYGTDTVTHDWNHLQVSEFQLRYRSVLLAN